MDKKERDLLRRRRREAAEAKPYPIGFCKAPDDQRFSETKQPERRAKPSLTGDELAAQIGAEKVTVVIGGVRHRMSRYEAMLRQNAQKAMGGDQRAMEWWLKTARSRPGSPDSATTDYAAEVRRRLELMAARQQENEATRNENQPKAPDDEPPSNE